MLNYIKDDQSQFFEKFKRLLAKNFPDKNNLNYSEYIELDRQNATPKLPSIVGKYN